MGIGERRELLKSDGFGKAGLGSEYWILITSDSINTSEEKKVQLRAARWVPHQYHQTSSIDLMLDGLAWPTLETTLHILQISPGVHPYQTKYNPSCCHPRRSTCQSHPSTYDISSHKTTCKQLKFFFPHTIVEWNILPVNVAMAMTLDSFEARVKSFLFF